MSETAWQDRIEGKLDELQKAVVTLARIEERTVTIFNKTNKIEARVDRLERGVWTERLFWILAVAVVGYFVSPV